MIQCSASRALDLELCQLAHTGEQSFAITTSVVFQHRQVLLVSSLLFVIEGTTGEFAAADSLSVGLTDCLISSNQRLTWSDLACFDNQVNP
jgi:hypothetical protein